MPALQLGTTLDGRFVLEEEAGRGGMAVVFRATDLREQRRVAVKMLHPDTRTSFILDHFAREAEILATVRHPYIVSYVAHGSTADGAAYLVVEWLDGESLGARLRRGPLTIAAAVQLGARLADALRATHARGVVHRDLKPDNIFLRQGELARIALLDFGVAHLTQAQAGRALTRTGEVIGTPEYMAPEQIRGERAIGPATDLFALGCVLFEALAGRPPFSGGQVASVLTRILFEEAPDVRTLRPGVPESLAALLGRLLTKDPAARLADAGTLLAELAQLSGQLPEEDAVPEAAAVRPTELRGALKELLCVVVGRPADTGAVTTAPSQGLTLTTDPDALRDALRALGGPADYLPDGSLVVVFRGAPSAVDQAVQAAQAALLVRERWPSARVAVATGRGHHAGLGPVGEAFDRAARLLLLGSTGGGVSAVGEALLDEVTASLIAGRFIMAPGRDGCFALLAARDAADELRPLPGRPTPCVCRGGVLAELPGPFAATAEQREGSAVVINGPQGRG